MKTVGIIGGIGPESTVAYYRQIVQGYRAQRKINEYPSVIINSIDMTRMLDLIATNRLSELVGFLLAELMKLQLAGAHFAALSSNTPHIVFEQLQAVSPLPLISIVESTLEAVKMRGFRTVGLFGTRFTMSGSFYANTFAAQGVRVIAPREEQQNYIHEKYMGELVEGVFNSQTRDQLIAIGKAMKLEHGIDALLLGGTELPLILTEPEYDVPRFSTLQSCTRQK